MPANFSAPSHDPPARSLVAWIPLALNSLLDSFGKELVGSFYRYKGVDLFQRLTGPPGETCLQMCVGQN